MNYRVSKKRPDSRTHTCGLFVLDGYSVVVELTEERIDQLQNLRKFGYDVEKTTAEPGGYDREGRLVDYESMVNHAVFGTPVKRLETVDVAQATKETVEKKDTSLDDESRMLRAELDAKGIRYHPSSRPDTLRKKLYEFERDVAMKDLESTQ